ncbi:TonB-dependent receptor [Sesbania bispinosa]|nr:TonB-dependent receptor [Sesbania bispinosa]
MNCVVFTSAMVALVPLLCTVGRVGYGRVRKGKQRPELVDMRWCSREKDVTKVDNGATNGRWSYMAAYMWQLDGGRD